MRGPIRDPGNIAVMYYTAAIVGIAAIAEFLGLGGIPAKGLEIGNVLFMALLLAFV